MNPRRLGLLALSILLAGVSSACGPPAPRESSPAPSGQVAESPTNDRPLTTTEATSGQATDQTSQPSLAPMPATAADDVLTDLDDLLNTIDDMLADFDQPTEGRP